MTYTRDSIKNSLKGPIKNKSGQIVDINTLINDSVLEVWMDLDLKSSKRRSLLAPKLFTDVFDYTCPTDLKGRKIIDVQPQKPDRATNFQWNLTTEEEFDRWKGNYNTSYTLYGQKMFTSTHTQGSAGINLVAFSDDDMVRKLKLSAIVSDDTIVIGNLDTLTGDGGTWTAFGDGTNLTADTDNYIRGSGSINWDISAAGGTTAGIYNAGLNSQDISAHIANGSFFKWHYIPSTTGITNYILRLGSDTSNYHSWTVTTNAQGNAFEVGWNLFKFDLTSPTDTGTPVNTAITYCAFYMTKAITKISETDYRSDWAVVKKGDYYNLVYYSKYPWQSSSGTWKENSTSDQDYINVDSDEYNLVKAKVVENAGWEVGEEGAAEKFAQKYEILKARHLQNYKSEAKITYTRYWSL